MPCPLLAAHGTVIKRSLLVSFVHIDTADLVEALLIPLSTFKQWAYHSQGMDRSSPGVLTHSQLHVEQRNPQNDKHQEIGHQKGTCQECILIPALNTCTEKSNCFSIS